VTERQTDGRRDGRTDMGRALQSCIRLFLTRGAFILEARLPIDSLQNGIVNKSPSDECRVPVGL